MKYSKKWILVGTALALCMSPVLWGCNPGGKGMKPSKAVIVSDKEISLRKGDMKGKGTSLSAPQYTTVEAGETKIIARAFYDAPPVIPHSIEDLSQGVEDNECLGCHEEGDEDTPAISPSHRIKAVVKSIQRSQSQNGMLHVVQSHAKVSEGINNARYYCTTCHVPQATNLSDLVENDFTKTIPKDAELDVLDDLNSFEY